MIVVVQSLSHVRLFAIPWTVACQAPLSSTISRSLLQFMSIESVMLPNHLILCRPLLLMPSIFPSNGVFSSESGLCIWCPKYWSFSISPPNEYLGFDFLYDWLVWSPSCPRDSQESSPAPQYESINSSALSLHVQLSHPYMTTEKTIALTIWTFVGQVKSLLF